MGHCGIIGNEEADIAPKEARTWMLLGIEVPQFDIVNLHKKNVTEKWKNHGFSVFLPSFCYDSGYYIIACQL